MVMAMTSPGSAAARSRGEVSPNRGPRDAVAVRPADAARLRPADAVRANRVVPPGVSRVGAARVPRAQAPSRDQAAASGDARIGSERDSPALSGHPPDYVKYGRLLR